MTRVMMGVEDGKMPRIFGRNDEDDTMKPGDDDCRMVDGC